MIARTYSPKAEDADRQWYVVEPMAKPSDVLPLRWRPC